MTGIHYTYQMQGKINDAIFELYALIIVYLTPNYPQEKIYKFMFVLDRFLFEKYIYLQY